MTSISGSPSWSSDQKLKREREIEQVREGLGITSDHLFELNFPTAELDQVPLGDLINSISVVFKQFQPEEVFLPHPGDIHSDHRITFEATSACTKWFRYPSVKRILTYETLSETDFSLYQYSGDFRPNLFVDISDYLKKKLDLISIYDSEVGEHPFPRSLESIRAQTILRGAQRGVFAAEAFHILKDFQ